MMPFYANNETDRNTISIEPVKVHKVRFTDLRVVEGQDGAWVEYDGEFVLRHDMGHGCMEKVFKAKISLSATADDPVLHPAVFAALRGMGEYLASELTETAVERAREVVDGLRSEFTKNLAGAKWSGLQAGRDGEGDQP